MRIRLRRFILSGALLALMPAALVGAAPPPPMVIAAPVVRTDFEDRIEALGTLKANESVALTALVTETVSALYFDDGDRVEQGQLLAEMTSVEEHAQLEEARALLAEAQRQYRRVQSLATQGTASRSLLDERRRESETAQARLNAIESRLSDRLIKAPFSGVVGLRDISVGALVEPGDVITTLDDDTVLKLDLAVPSIYLPSLRPGLPISARTRAFGDEVFSGQIRSVDSRADPVTRSIVVRARLPNPDRRLKPGMLMQVTLRKNQRQTLVIPEAALMPSGNRQQVLILLAEGDGHRVELREVEIGSRRPGQVEVTDGLAEGELVVSQGTLRVRSGQAVRLRAIDDGSIPLGELLRQPVAGSEAQ